MSSLLIDDDNHDWQRIALADADLCWRPHWLDAAESDTLFAALHAAIPWENHSLRMFGREVAAPRMSCWIGDAGASYTYSRRRYEPHPWPLLLAELRTRVEQACGSRFNSVLANLYRDGADTMGWHSDAEPELGERPVIASLSLGAERTFRLRRKLSRGESVPPALNLPLPHGSLLRMAGDTQTHYRHALPRERGESAARINLTFRLIQPARLPQ